MEVVSMSLHILNLKLIAALMWAAETLGAILKHETQLAATELAYNFVA